MNRRLPSIEPFPDRSAAEQTELLGCLLGGSVIAGLGALSVIVTEPLLSRYVGAFAVGVVVAVLGTASVTLMLGYLAMFRRGGSAPHTPATTRHLRFDVRDRASLDELVQAILDALDARDRVEGVFGSGEHRAVQARLGTRQLTLVRLFVEAPTLGLRNVKAWHPVGLTAQIRRPPLMPGAISSKTFQATVLAAIKSSALAGRVRLPSAAEPADG